MIDLVITHLAHPWGPPWTLATLGDPWRPLATLGDPWRNAWKLPISPKIPNFSRIYMRPLYDICHGQPNTGIITTGLVVLQKKTISVLNFWWIFGSYHSIHMVGGQEKGFWPHPKTLPIGRLMEQNRWFFTTIGSSQMASEMIADHRNHPQLGRKWKWHPSNICWTRVSRTQEARNWTTMFQDVKIECIKFRLNIVWVGKATNVKDFSDVTLAWEGNDLKDVTLVWGDTFL